MERSALHAGPSRRALLRVAGGVALGAASGLMPRLARAAPPLIRYATGGGIGPTEIETVIFLDWMKQNVLPHYGKEYTVAITFTRSTPEAATLLAAGQADIACQSWAIFAVSVLKNAIAGGTTIIADNFQEGRPDYATGGYYVRKDSPIRTIADLRGKTVAVNAFGTAADLVLRVILRKAGLDPKKDIQTVEIPFPAIPAAITKSAPIAAPSCCRSRRPLASSRTCDRSSRMRTRSAPIPSSSKWCETIT